ncbi:MAG: DUF4142 domain-containing protein [Terriglobales bacterium]
MTHAVRGSHLALVAALAVGLSCAPLFAQNQSAANSSSDQSSAAANPASAANPNQAAVTAMNTINKDEIAGAKMMENKAQSAKVRDFAKMLESDHQGAEGKLQGIASNDRLTLDMNHHMHQQAQRMQHRLNDMSAYRADTAYVRDEARDHARAIRKMQALEAKVNNPNLRHYIESDYIPMLQKHEHHARTVIAEMGGQPAAEPAGNAGKPPHELNQPRYEHRPWNLPAQNQSGEQNGAKTSAAQGHGATGQPQKNATPPANVQQPARPAGQQAPAGKPPAAAANPSRKAGMPATGSPLGLLVLAGAALTGLGLGAKRRKS